MNILDIAQSRYTTKLYDESAKISEENIALLKQVLQLSPSSINSQPWKFIFIEDEKVRKEFAKVSPLNVEKIITCSHLVVFTVVDNLSIFENQIRETLPSGYVDYYNAVLKPKGEIAVKSWLKQQVYLSLGVFLSACASLGIDSTPMEGIDKDEFDELLSVRGYKTLFAVAIGYRDQEDQNQPQYTSKIRLPLDDVIITV